LTSAAGSKGVHLNSKEEAGTVGFVRMRMAARAPLLALLSHSVQADPQQIDLTGVITQADAEPPFAVGQRVSGWFQIDFAKGSPAIPLIGPPDSFRWVGIADNSLTLGSVLITPILTDNLEVVVTDGTNGRGGTLNIIDITAGNEPR
jgi:hypothetical protein